MEPAHPADDIPADEHKVFLKTDAGRQLLAAPRTRLGLRDRQIVLLCTGQRNAAVLTQIFGPATPADLRRLVEAGLIEAVAPTAWPDAPTEFLPTLPPLGNAAVQSANQSGFGVTQPQPGAALPAAHAQACVMLAEVGGAAAEQLLRESADAVQEDDVLAFLTRAIALAVHTWGEEAAMPGAQRIARLLPRAAVARLIDCLVDDGSASLLVATLYERLLSDSAFGAEDSTPP